MKRVCSPPIGPIESSLEPFRRFASSRFRFFCVFLGASSRRRVARARHFDARTARDAPHRDRDHERDSTLRPPSATDPQTALRVRSPFVGASFARL
jgi:hypothetical protein